MYSVQMCLERSFLSAMDGREVALQFFARTNMHFHHTTVQFMIVCIHSELAHKDVIVN